MNDDEEARLRLVGEISRLEEDAGGVDGAIASAKRRAGELDERRREGPCAHLCIGIVNVELIAVGAGLLLWGPAADDHAALGHSESVGSADSVLQAVGASSLAIGVLGLVTCCCSEPDSTSSYAYFVSMLLLTCGAAWASWFAVGNTPLVAAELQLHASQHWLHWLAVLGADTRATEGDTVADKNCEKIHYIADNIWCCGAGTSAGKTAAARRREGLPGIPELATRAARRYRFDDSTDLLAAGAAPHGHREAAARGHCVHAAQTDAVQVPGQCERRTRPGRR